MRRLRHADVRFDPAHERLLAPGEIEAVGVRGREADLLERSDTVEVLGHLGYGAPEALWVLLGRDDREAEYLRALDEDRGVVRHALEVGHRGPERLLDVDHHQRSPLDVEHPLRHRTASRAN